MPRYSTRKQQQEQQQEQQQQENASSPGAEYVPSSSNDNSEDEFEQTTNHHQDSFSQQQNAMSSSILMISEQEALATDTYSKNGRSGKFNISAKNVPIKLRIASTVSLRSNPVSAELVYEQDGSPVISPANQPHPLEWSLVVGNNEFTGVATCRILVLSTQHQGSFFQVKLTCQGQSVLSTPIRVISKRSHATRIVERQQRAAQQILGSEDTVVSIPTTTTTTTVNNKRKRSQAFRTSNKNGKHSDDSEDEESEMMMDAPDNDEYSPPANKIAATTTHHQHAGKSIMVVPTTSTAQAQSNNVVANNDVLKMLNEIKAQQTLMMQQINKQSSSSTIDCTKQTSTNTTMTAALDLESSFRALVRAYLELPLEERASKMRKVAQESFETEQVAAELGQICSNNLASVFGNASSSNANNSSSTNNNNNNTNDAFEFGVSLLTSSTGGQEFTSALQV